MIKTVPGRGKRIGKDIVMRKTTLVMTQTMIKHLMLRELQGILNCKYVEKTLGLKSPMIGN